MRLSKALRPISGYKWQTIKPKNWLRELRARRNKFLPSTGFRSVTLLPKRLPMSKAKKLKFLSLILCIRKCRQWRIWLTASTRPSSSSQLGRRETRIPCSWQLKPASSGLTEALKLLGAIKLWLKIWKLLLQKGNLMINSYRLQKLSLLWNLSIRMNTTVMNLWGRKNWASRLIAKATRCSKCFTILKQATLLGSWLWKKMSRKGLLGRGAPKSPLAWWLNEIYSWNSRKESH